MTAAKKTTASKPEARTAEGMKPAVETAKVAEEAVAVGKETMEEAVAATKVQFDKASDAARRGYDELSTLNKDTMDAFLKSANILNKGFEDLSKAYMTYAQSTMESGVEATKALMTAKNVSDYMDIQTDLLRSNIDATIAEGTKISELVLKLSNDTVQPLQERLNVTFEKTLKTAAA